MNRLSRRAWLGIVVLVLAVVSALVIANLGKSSTPAAEAASAAPASVTLPASPISTQSSSPTPSTAAVTSTTPHAPALQQAPLSEARAIAIPEIGFSVPVSLTSVAPQGYIDPPGFDRVYRVSDRGVQPGVNADDTTYLACHTHSKRDASFAPCNTLQDHVSPGQRVIVTTDAGTVTYQITSVRKIDKDKLADDQEVWAYDAGRLVWITCFYYTGTTSQYNFVIFANLMH